MRQLWFYLYSTPSKPNYFKALGSAGHLAIEYNFREKQNGGVDPSVDSVLDVFTSSYDAALPTCEKSTVDPVALRNRVTGSRRETGTLPLFLRDHARYIKHHARYIKPKLVEKRFELEIEGIPVPVVGTIDLLSEEGALNDWKFRSGARIPSEREVARSFQLATYAFAVEALGEEVKEAAEFELVCNPQKVSRVVPIRVEPHQIPQDSILDEYGGIVRFVALANGDPELYPMTNPTAWWCSEKWCGWADKCPRFGGNHEQARS
jgi:hypothetical protein